MNRIEAVIFDCDGVMFESRQANLAYYNRILEQFSYPRVEVAQKERAQLCYTASSPVVLATLLQQKDVVPALSFAATLDDRDLVSKMEIKSNLTTLLDHLDGHYPLAIATNRGNSILSVLEYFKLRNYFSVVTTSHDVEHPKPAPDMLLLAVEQLNIKPENCLFIGDSELDKVAAAEAHIRFAGYGGVVGEISLVDHLELLDYLGV